ncbi:uncharacterized protein LOC109821371 [Asparagus officinalis]|uniref:uncharacterized protein LOC109821371 n=1 Tax=Asparagus officinalis TaxID=4686 RepID=UPI00098DF80B|nr:uncharacterized protein LOC109821371 [Asparagus officinalis]
MIGKFGNVTNVLNVIAGNCSESKVHLSSIYNVLIHQNAQAPWYKTVWDGWHYPKHSFILWLAIHQRLLTQERLCRMRMLDTNTCVLCSHQQPETCKHLFFECDYSVNIWNRVMDWLNYKWRSCIWDNVVDWYTLRLKGEGFMKKLKRMALSTSVYAIWQERNQRIFQSIARGPEIVLRSVKFTILSKILNMTFLSI